MARQMRRKNRELPQERAMELLERAEYAVLSTVNTEGGAYGVAISPVVIQGTVYFHCALAGQKLENLQKEPRVCLTVVGRTEVQQDKFTTFYESAVAFGRAVLVEEDEEKTKALRALCEKYCPGLMGEFDAAIEASLPRTGVVRIALEDIKGKSKGYLPAGV